MAYESPIRLVTELENKIIEDQREGIYKAVLSYQIDISKDELFQLLYGDRKQYEKGFADGRADATKHGRWIVLHGVLAGDDIYGDMGECSNCGSSNCFDNYCGNCGAKRIGTRKDEVEE